jgi:glycosyltransferase involved in cell wall biosynthesis
MSVGSLVVRTVLVAILPALVYLTGNDPGTAVTLLSALAAVFEILVTFLNEFGANGSSIKRGGRSKNVRPVKSFPLQLGVLYIVQLWFLLLRAGTGSGESTLAPAQAGVAATEASSFMQAKIDAPLPPLPGAENYKAKIDAPLPPLPGAESYKAIPLAEKMGNVGPSPPAPPLPQAGTEDAPIPAEPANKPFELDAPIEELRWSPKTISVVLPCAEERELALKTVQSVFKETPPHILHEIVVVDDGSNPPLSETHLKPGVQQQYKVKIKRHDETVGLIGAKKTGGDAASGDLIVFFDCHVGPQPGWHQDFIHLIGENYRRMVIPQITALNIDTWTQIGGGGMSKCYVTWDGDFKWGGTDDMYMGMLSGGLAGLSKRWWEESGGFDSQMLGWGGENIDQGIRMWVCGGEIVGAPNSQVAHMWRVDGRTAARYKHVGDTSRNRARAMYAWMGEFSKKLDDYPMFQQRKQSQGDHWYGDMGTFQKVKDRLGGCHPFAWYLRRFKTVYEDAGIVPSSIYMIKEESSGLCLLYQGQAGTSGQGREGVVLDTCDEGNHRFFWHPGNRRPPEGKCCSGIRAWNTDQCFEGGQGGGKAITGICEVSGSNGNQHWKLHKDGSLKRGEQCIGPGESPRTLQEGPCFSFRSRGGAKFSKQAIREPIETQLYHKAQHDHPEIFARLNKKTAGFHS